MRGDRRAPWRGRYNAEIYDAFTREYPIYGELNRQLVRQAKIRGDHRVLDLACGTGATAAACLARLGTNGQVVAVDASPEMIDLAHGSTADPRVTYHVAAAQELTAVATGPFDRTLCNAALWQFPAVQPVLDQLARVLGPGGRFLFNAPSDRIAGQRPASHAFLVALARVYEESTGRAFQQPDTRIDPHLLDEMLVAAGFSPATATAFHYEGLQGELMTLMEIPAMIEPLAPDLDEDQRAHLLAEARLRCDPAEAVTLDWITFETKLAG